MSQWSNPQYPNQGPQPQGQQQYPQGQYPQGQYPTQYPGQFPGYYTPPYVGQNPTGKATASLVLGLIGLLAWCLPLVGLPLAITGLVLGMKGMKSTSRGMAMAGVVLNILAPVATIVNAGIGAYMGATGQHQLINQWQGKGR